MIAQVTTNAFAGGKTSYFVPISCHVTSVIGCSMSGGAFCAYTGAFLSTARAAVPETTDRPTYLATADVRGRGHCSNPDRPAVC